MIERREFVRIETQLPLRYRVLNPTEYRREKARILTDPQGRVNPILQLLERWASQDDQRGLGELERLIVPVLVSIHEKLDHILFLLNPQDPVALRFEDAQPVNMSGSGLGLTAKESFPPGTLLAVQLLLPFPSPLVINTIGKVGWVRPSDAEPHQWYLGIQFDVIHEEDREAVIRYILREQRIALRARNALSTSTDVEPHLAPQEPPQEPSLP